MAAKPITRSITATTKVNETGNWLSAWRSVTVE